MTTQDFWRTFPGLLVAIPFLGICGFVTVYLLGAKGYCTYGCPYAGFFVPLDRFAVGRIRVTDACEQCGHCTAVCTSNVRVHEEVREYGMVVDPGCMKCLDCVSVCPNDALYFGFGRSASAKGPPKHEAPTPRFDLTRPEEVMLLGVFAVTFFSVFGAYKSLPYLMASGVAAVITFLLWKAWRLVRDRNVGLQRHRLKINGKLKRSGVVVAMLAVVSAVFALQCATLKMIEVSADHYAARVVLNTKLVFSDQRRPLSLEMEFDAERAITLYRLLHSIPNGGLGLFNDPSVDGSIGWLHCARLAFGEAEQSFRRWIERNDRVENISWALGQILRVQHKDDEATQYYYDLVSAKPSWEELADEVAGWHLQSGRPHEAVRLRRSVLAHSPQSVSAMRKLALSLLDADQRDEGTKLLRKVVEREPDHAWSLVSLARVLASNGQTEDAYEALSRALALEPKNAQFNRAMGRLLAGMRRHVEAEAFLEKARALEDK
ncbi:MAG: tetratricopeptide repeat protein [Planctomycetes bacterium]|nr:tetratricopeptide repeat protein [Planctomycetota bacterium]